MGGNVGKFGGVDIGYREVYSIFFFYIVGDNVIYWD